jgi:hypothetical protein
MDDSRPGTYHPSSLLPLRTHRRRPSISIAPTYLADAHAETHSRAARTATSSPTPPALDYHHQPSLIPLPFADTFDVALDTRLALSSMVLRWLCPESQQGGGDRPSTITGAAPNPRPPCSLPGQLTTTFPSIRASDNLRKDQGTPSLCLTDAVPRLSTTRPSPSTWCGEPITTISFHLSLEASSHPPRSTPFGELLRQSPQPRHPARLPSLEDYRYSLARPIRDTPPRTLPRGVDPGDYLRSSRSSHRRSTSRLPVPRTPSRRRILLSIPCSPTSATQIPSSSSHRLRRRLHPRIPLRRRYLRF